MYASSSFYGPHHPTMEEQVDLARRISNSLSDISNKQSKGQSMYVNRKKRSVKWVHEGEIWLAMVVLANCLYNKNSQFIKRAFRTVKFVWICCIFVILFLFKLLWGKPNQRDLYIKKGHIYMQISHRGKKSFCLTLFVLNCVCVCNSMVF